MAKYIVVEEAWDYNDEEYIQAEGDPYTIASRLYDTEEEAQAEADRRNETGSFGETTYEDDDTGEDVVDEIHPFRVEKIEE
jgi:hypothetical protein